MTKLALRAWLPEQFPNGTRNTIDLSVLPRTHYQAQFITSLHTETLTHTHTQSSLPRHKLRKFEYTDSNQVKRLTTAEPRDPTALGFARAEIALRPYRFLE